MSKNFANATSVSKNSTDNRPKPMTPKAGYTQTRRRYGNGGKVNK